MRPSPVLFDLDGTLVDRDGALRRCFPGVDLSLPHEELLAWCGVDQATLGTLLAAALTPDPALNSALARIPHRALVSNGGGPTQRAKLQAAQLPFEHVFISGEQGVAKPDPELFWRAARALGAAPEECLMVGDSDVDEEGARAAGMQFRRVTRVLTAADL